MDIMRILRRSFDITWSYRALWVFGFILALTAPRGGGGGGGGSGGGGGGGSYLGHPGLAGLSVPKFFEFQDAAIIAVVIIVALLLAIIFAVGRVVAETSLIRMVNDYEDTGVRVKVRQGFRMGWSRPALRIFVIDLLLVLGVLVASVLIFGVAAAPLAGLMSDSDAVKVVGMASGIFLLLLALALFIAAVIFLSVLLPFFHRACILEGLGVLESYRRGWAVFRSRLSDAIIVALVLFCAGLALSLVLFPIVFLLLFGGATLASLPGLAAGLISSLFLQGDLPVVVGLFVALPIIILIVVIPALFLSGLFQVFTSAAWTLTYRDILALTRPLPEAPAAPQQLLAS
jgi:hypothetical protein